MGSIRPKTKHGLLGKHNGIAHDGFYTQPEIKEVVEYAAQRNITVVPEIEIPGHALAALTAYPEFSCRGLPPGLATGPGVFGGFFCAGKEATFEFLCNLLDGKSGEGGYVSSTEALQRVVSSTLPFSMALVILLVKRSPGDNASEESSSATIEFLLALLVRMRVDP